LELDLPTHPSAYTTHNGYLPFSCLSLSSHSVGGEGFAYASLQGGMDGTNATDNNKKCGRVLFTLHEQKSDRKNWTTKWNLAK